MWKKYIPEQPSSEPKIEFRCYTEDWDVIPKPYSARKHMPEWYKKLKDNVKDDEGNPQKGFNSFTVKRCPPVLDAMSVGWIIPLAADIHITTNDDCSGVNWDSQFEKPIMQSHSLGQVEGHPDLPKPPIKWLNYWSIRIEDGYSILFVDPLNRPQTHFTCVSGLVDCDKYEEFINFPGFITTPNLDTIIEAGTPLIQAIPIKRESFELGSDIHPFNAEELETLQRTRRQRTAHQSLYRDKKWVKK